MRAQFYNRLVLMVLIALLLGGLSAFAQMGTTSLHGTVLDNSRAAVGGARVTLANAAQAFAREVTTPSSGEFEFLALPPGTYVLTVEKEGFNKYEQKSLQLLVNVPTTVNVVLKVGSVSTQVEVSAESETINTTDASLGTAFNENQVKQLPLESRNVPDLLSLQAGVVYTGNRPDIDPDVDTRSGSVNGSHSDQSNVTLDGVSVNDKGAHSFTSVLPVTLDSVQEFRVTTTNYGADEGTSSAAQVALVTKSGTNNFHGSAYEYNRNSYFSANDYFIKASQLASGLPNQPNQLNRNIFGGSVGGPILKNRLFLFLNYEGYRDAESVSALRTVPTAAMRDGVIQYLCQTNPDGSPNTSLCPGNTVRGNSGASYTAPAGYQALSPQQITAMDSTSLGPHGPDPAVLSYISKYPLPNDQTTGDLVNTAGYRFRAPTDTTKNWYIAKLDYNITSDAKQRLSISGALANENSAGAPFLPGTPPEQDTVNYNKGIIAGYSSVLTSSLVNNFRYGYVRESVGTIGDSNQPWNLLLAFDQGITRSSAFQRPVNNFTDDVSWIHGVHTWQFGFQFAFLRSPSQNFNNSFSSGTANPDWLLNSGLSTTSASALNPANHGYPAVDSTFVSNYDYPMTSLLGMVTLVNAQYNYGRDGNPIAQGAPVSRNFAENSYELYAQDSWKVKPTLTVTLGLRYSLFSPPWEVNGLEVAPTMSLNSWFNGRAAGMMQGRPSSAAPLISYNWAGPANGKPGFYNWDHHDFGPRIAVAWAPDSFSGLLGDLFGAKGQTSIRAGFGIVYDRVGESLADTFDQNGSFGLSTQLSNPSDIQTSLTAPRITNMNTIPTTDYSGNPIFIPPPAGTFPKTFPSSLNTGGSAITWGVDNSLKTPYSYTIDMAVSRELRSGFSLDVAYVGRLSHRLLAQDDLAMPLDIYDKKSGLDYFAAENALAKLFRPQLNAGSTTATLSFKPSQVPANVQQFWTDEIQPPGKGGAYTLSGCTGTDASGNPVLMATTNPVIAAFDLFCSTRFNDSLALYNLDTYGIPDFNNPNVSYFPVTGQNTFYSPQFSSLYSWRSMANANYNALQVSLHHRMTKGFQFDLNYTFSKSIDLASDAERIGPASYTSSLNNIIINAWNPNQERGVSSYDVPHQFNANWIFELPFGRGRSIGSDSNRILDAFIGGWQLSGLFRWTSGFPVNVDNGYSNFPTNFEQEGNADLVGYVKTGAYFNTGTPNIFVNGPAAISSFAPAYAGESGQRNVIRGNGYFGIDLGVSKRWTMPWSEKQSLQFRWEIFNVTNSVRFDVQSSLLSSALTLGSGGSFGNYSGLLTNPRIMQFALRYEF
ncbi:MAG: TonB-dependent receptor [Candidatus Acidiferrum sp.]